MVERFRSLLKDESGQALSEYGLIIMLIGMGAVAVLFGFRGKISGWFKTFGEKVDKCAEAGAVEADCK